MEDLVKYTIRTRDIESVLGLPESVGIGSYDYAFIVAEEKDQIVGYSLALKTTYEYELISVYVNRDHRMMGVGGGMVKEIDRYLLDRYGHYSVKFSATPDVIREVFTFYQKTLNVSQYKKIFHYTLSSDEMDWCFCRRGFRLGDNFSLKHITELSEEERTESGDLFRSYDEKFKELTFVLKEGEHNAGFIIANNIKPDTIFILYLNILPEYRSKGGAYSCIRLFTERVKDLPAERRQWLSFYFYADEERLCRWYSYLFGDLYDKHTEHCLISRSI